MATPRRWRRRSSLKTMTPLTMTRSGDRDRGDPRPQRMMQVTETLLRGIVDRKANTAILDVTSIGSFDTEGVDGLLRCVNAVRLVGADVMLTGVSPDAASALAGLGLNLGNLQTFGTLRHAVARALKLKRKAT